MNRLDLYVPCKRKFTPPVGELKPVEGLRPVVILVHGGVRASRDK